MKALWTILVVTALALIAGSCSSDAPRDDSGAIVEEGELDVFSVAVGDCFDDPPEIEDGGQEITELAAVPCDQPHDNEVYHAYDLPDGEFGGPELVEAQAADGCVDEFEGFVGLDYFESDLDIFWLTPTADSWSNGDREVICAVYAIDLTKLVGSVEGAAR